MGIHPVAGYPEVHLIEAVVEAPPCEVDVGRFGQSDPGRPPDNWQVAYDERYLSPDGQTVLGYDPPAESPTRLAFFLHYCDLNRPLLTPDGPLPLPEPSPLPDRLREIEYEPVD